MENCIFCQIIAGTIPAYPIWENDDFIAILDIKPNNLGHSLIIPKAHYKNIFDLPETLLAGVGQAIQTVAEAVLTGAKAAGINVGMNNGSAAGQLIPHAHIHIIPRFDHDGLVHWRAKENIAQSDFEETAKKITSQFTKNNR